MKAPIRSAFWVIVVVIAAVVAFSIYRESYQPDDLKFDLLQRNIKLNTSDGKELDAVISVPIHADSTGKPEVYPGVILLSPYLESGQVYGTLPAMLGRKGLAVLTVNARYSIGEDSLAFMNPDDIANLPLDAEAAIEFLEDSPHVDARRIGMLGTGLTARAALLGAHNRKNIKTISLVSAALDEAGMEVVRNDSFRPLLILVSISDGPAGGQAKEILAANNNPQSKIESYFGAGEDSDIWRATTSTEMSLLIADWMQTQLSKSEQ